MFKRFRKTTGLVVALAAITAVVGANAFTASNTVSASKAGMGVGAITGYAVSNIVYTNAGGNVTGVSFNLDGAASSVKVKLYDASSETDCGAAAATTFLVTCVMSVPAATADNLTVVANQ